LSRVRPLTRVPPLRRLLRVISSSLCSTPTMTSRLQEKDGRGFSGMCSRLTSTLALAARGPCAGSRRPPRKSLLASCSLGSGSVRDRRRHESRRRSGSSSCRSDAERGSGNTEGDEAKLRTHERSRGCGCRSSSVNDRRQPASAAL
jgi:hypothetical protein